MAHLDISEGEIPGYVVSKKVRNMAGYNRKGGRVGALALFSIVALTACNGPNQEAGREQDTASANARGRSAESLVGKELGRKWRYQLAQAIEKNKHQTRQ